LGLDDRDDRRIAFSALNLGVTVGRTYTFKVATWIYSGFIPP